MKKLSTVILALAMVIAMQAQTLKEPQWVASVEQEILNIYATQLNIPLIETKASKLFALEPTTGAVLWKMPLPRPITSITQIDGTPYSFIDGQLININNGKVVDLMTRMSGTMQDWYIIPESYDLFIHSMAPEYFTVVDLFTGDVRYSVKSDVGGHALSEGKGKLTAAIMDVNNASAGVDIGLECAPISNKSGGIIVAGYGKLTNIDQKGQVIWSVQQPKKKKGGLVQTVDNKTELLLDESRDQFYIMKSKLMMAIKLSNGTEAWPEHYAFKGDAMVNTPLGILPLTMYKEDADGSSNTGMFAKAKFNLVDASTGKAVWGSDLELKAAVDRYQVLSDGRVAIINFNQKNSRFQVIDTKTGKFVYADDVKLKGRVENFIVGTEKAMFSTTRGIDLLDLKTGADLLDKMPKFDEDADVATICNKQFIYSIDTKNKDVFKTDLLTNDSKKVLGRYKFDVNEPLAKYDVLEDGRLFLASEHHMKVYSTAGEELISKPFDYQGKGWDRFNKATSDVASAYRATARSLAFAASALVVMEGGMSGNLQQSQQLANQIKAPEMEKHRIAQNEKAAAYYLSLKRLRPDGIAPGSFFIRRDKTAKQSYISYVSKATGDVIFDIPLQEDSVAPEFAIGAEAGYLYYAPQFVNKDKAEWQAIFNPAKLKAAEAANKAGFVAGYQF
jgi:hypothetical protein